MLVAKILSGLRIAVEVWTEARAMQREAHRRYRHAEE
jgi:hypothetical protein